MSNSDSFLERQRYGGPKIGGADFYEKRGGINAGRLFLVKVDGVDLPCWQFLQHSIFKGKQVPTERVICPKHFDSKADCELCREAADLYEEGEQEKASGKKAKKTSWFAFVSLSDEEETVRVLNLPHGATQRVLIEVAGVGGWKAVNEETGLLEADWEADDFKSAFSKGVPLCFGPVARDLKFRYNPNGGFNCYPEVGFSERPGREITATIPDLRAIWARMNKVNSPVRKRETDPVAPAAAKRVAKKRTARKK